MSWKAFDKEYLMDLLRDSWTRRRFRERYWWMTTTLSANATLALGLLRARTVKPGNVLTLWLMLTQSSIVSCSTIEFLSAQLAHLDKSLFKRTTEGTLKYVYRAVTCEGLPFSRSHFRAPFRQSVVLHAREGSHHITYTIHILHFALSTLHRIGFEFVRSM